MLLGIQPLALPILDRLLLLLILVLIRVKQRRLSLRLPTLRLHHPRVVLRLRLEALKERVRLRLGEVGEDIDAFLPEDLERVVVFVVVGGLGERVESASSREERGKKGEGTHLSRHRIDMHPLLDPKLAHKHIERLVKDADDSTVANNWPVALRQVGDEDAEEEVLALLLCETSRFLLDVACLRDLRDGLRVEREPRLAAATAGCALALRRQNGFELAMDHNIGVTTNRGGEVRVEGDVESVVAVLGDVKHAGTEVFGALHRSGREVLEGETLGGVGDASDGGHQGLGRGWVEVDAETLHAVREGFEAAVDWRLVATEEGLVGESGRDLAGDGDVGEEHELRRECRNGSALGNRRKERREEDAPPQSTRSPPSSRKSERRPEVRIRPS